MNPRPKLATRIRLSWPIRVAQRLALKLRRGGKGFILRITCTVHRRNTLLEMRRQHVARTECRCIQPDSEYGMCPKTLESCLRGVGCFGCSKAEAERRLHDEQREHYGANAVE